jgi:hypothetical protein
MRRVLFGLVCVLIVLTGLGNLLNRRLEYQNYKGFAVFAPFAILIGCLGLTLVILRPRFFVDSEKKPDHHSTSPSHRQRKRR